MRAATGFSISSLLLCLGIAGNAAAEPWIAVTQGQECRACHVNPAGGGLRNDYGNVYGQSILPAERVGGADQPYWNGTIGEWLRVGADMRGVYRYVDTPNAQEVSEFDVRRATVYVEAEVIADRLSVYLDQQVAPGGSLNREAYLRLADASGNWSLVAGQFFLPYGWRLEDDSAFVRQNTGINFATPDRGVMLEARRGEWTTLVSLTNGSGGGSEFDPGKQISLVSTYVRPRWRAGFSFNQNDNDIADRTMGGLFGGLRTGPISWLAEVDWIEDDSGGGGRTNSIATLLEANWQPRRGHNIKLSHDWFDPDDDIDEDEQARFSLLWEYTPMQFLQARIGVRVYDGIPQVDSQNRDEFFAELHAFF